LGVVTSTVPVVAPVGTLVVIKDFETTLKAAAVPLKVTLVAPEGDRQHPDHLTYGVIFHTVP